MPLTLMDGDLELSTSSALMWLTGASFFLLRLELFHLCLPQLILLLLRYPL